MTTNIGVIAGFIFICAVFVYAYLAWLFSLARSKKDRKDLFFLVLYAPYVLTIIGLLVFVFSGAGLGLWGLILLFALVIERIIWGISLYEVAGNGDIAWFVMIFFLSPMLWIVYQVQKIG